mgnify:CR=1 FL=1
MKNLPTIPKEEFKQRRDNLRDLMISNQIDIIIAYSDDRATFGQQFSRYYFNYQPHFEPACLVIQANEDSYIITGPESEEFVLNNSYCTKVLIADVFFLCHARKWKKKNVEYESCKMHSYIYNTK